MINYIIVDDDEFQIEVLKKQLSKLDGISCLESYTNVYEALKNIPNLNPDFLILDIEMPDLSGIQLSKSLNNPPPIIFLTSHLGYAHEAFEIEAVDYLIKPAATERLVRAIDKVKKLLNKNATVNEDTVQFENESFFVKDKNTYYKTQFKEVIYIESSGNFTIIYTTNNQKRIVLANLSKMEEQLPNQIFIRISRTHIVNKDFVKAINQDIVKLDNIELNIGGHYLETVFEKIIGNNYIKRK